ncbi:MAG: hypothetical protein QNK85_00590 [Crocinitomicaceae bacterium]
MENIQKYKYQIQEVESLVIKLENGELNLEELTILEGLTRALHERSVILKYKAFEQKVNPEANVVDLSVEASKPVGKDLKGQVTEEPTIEFSILSVDDAAEEEVALTEEKSEEVTKPIVEEPIEPIVVELEEKNAVPNTERSFLDLIQSVDNSINARFNDSKLETLVGAFSLNQKLRYINELFDGSSESFSYAIKSLDAKPTMDEAKEIISSLASEHEWDTEEESVIEFMAVLNRRYA